MFKKSIFSCMTAICFISICSAMEPVSNAEFQTLMEKQVNIAKAQVEQLTKERDDLKNANNELTSAHAATKEDLKKIYYYFGCAVYWLANASRFEDSKGKMIFSLRPQKVFKDYNLPEIILNGINDEDERERFEWELYWSLPPELRDENKIAKIMGIAPDNVWKTEVCDYRILTPEERKRRKIQPNMSIKATPLIPHGFSQEDILKSKDNFPKAIDIAFM